MIETIPLEEFANYLAIDKNSLDDMLIQQPELIHQVGLLYANAVDHRDTLKDTLARTDAQLNDSFRADKIAKGVKFTEGLLANSVIQDREHIKAYQQYTEARLQASKLAELKEAFAQRSYMIKDLCNLYINEYFVRNMDVKGAGKSQRAEEARASLSIRRRKTAQQEAHEDS